jgi:hypothetical protein
VSTITMPNTSGLGMSVADYWKPLREEPGETHAAAVPGSDTDVRT